MLSFIAGREKLGGALNKLCSCNGFGTLLKVSKYILKKRFHAEDEDFGEKYSQVKNQAGIASSLEPGSQVCKPGDPLEEPGRLEWESWHSRMERMTYTVPPTTESRNKHTTGHVALLRGKYTTASFVSRPL